MAPSPSKKPRLQLRSRARDDVLLNRLLSEVRSHEKKVRDELKRADETIADLPSELDQERNYISRVNKKRDAARTQLEDTLADLECARRDVGGLRASLDTAETAARRTITELEAKLAEALRKKNRERYARDLEVRKKMTKDKQRGLGKSLRAMLEKCGQVSKASGVSFDAEASSSDEEHPPKKIVEPTLEIAATAAPEVAHDLPPVAEIQANGCGLAAVEDPASSRATGREGLPATSSDASSSSTSSETK